MAQKFRRIGVLTSGGDAPGMNAAVRSVVRSAIGRGVEVMAIYGGYRGLIEDDVKMFTERDVSNIIGTGGTAIYSDRCLEFKEEPGMQKAIATCKKYDIDGIVTIGGDGTFRGAMDLTKRGVACIGIPGTIDNDITSTDHSIGFDTAMNTVIEMVDRLRDTCESHARCNVVEVMGRDAGYIALQTGIATGAAAIALKEIPFDEEATIQKMIKMKEQGKRGFIVMVAEGLEGYGPVLRQRIQERTGVESKYACLAHVVRGGNPTLRDRLLASRMGDKAVDMLLAGQSNLVICERKGDIVPLDIHYALTLDRMYKGKLKDGDLDPFTPEQIAAMEEECAAKRAAFSDLYDIANLLSK